MQIINTTKTDLRIAAGHIVPGNGSASVPADVLASARRRRVVRAWFFCGALVEGAEGEPTLARDELIGDAIFEISSDDFTKAGKPDVDAINALMPEGQPKVTAAERDRIWAEIEAETD